MAIPDKFELANDSEFRLLANFSAPPRAGRIRTIEPSGQVRVETDDPDGGDVLAWPLNGFSYAVDDVVYIAFAANSPDTAIVIGAKAPLPTLDAGALPEAYVPADGSDPLTADWDIGEDRRIKAEALRARDGEGLKLEDDAGNLGIYIADEGNAGFINSALKGWSSAFGAIQFGYSGAFMFSKTTNEFNLTSNAYYDGGWKRIQSGYASMQYQKNGEITLFTSATGAADSSITWIPVLKTTQAAFAGVGTESPQGKLHVHDGTGGMIFVTKSAISNVSQTIIADGAGDVTRGIAGFIVIYDGTSTVANSITMLPGDTVDVVIGSYTLRLALNVNGALTAVRQAGSGTASLALMGMWM
jgi:hypothetical protein